MKHLKIEVKYTGLGIGSCEYTVLESFAETAVRQFTLKGLKIYQKRVIEFSQDPLTLGFFYVNDNGVEFPVTEVNLVLMEEIEMYENGDYTLPCQVRWDFYDDPYDQNLIDALFHWGTQGAVEWRSPLATEEQKEAILRARYYLGGKPTQVLPPGKTYTVDGKDIKGWADFYCLLGEIFYGDNGFLAIGADSLEDILIDIAPRSISDRSTIHFENSTELRKRLGDGYLDMLVHIFEKSRFQVLLSSE